MQEIKLEVNGRIQTVTVEQLRTLALKNFVKADARLWLDGVECRVGDVLVQLQSGASTLQAPGAPPAGRSPVSLPNALPKGVPGAPGNPRVNFEKPGTAGWQAPEPTGLNALQLPLPIATPNRIPLIIGISVCVAALIGVVAMVAFGGKKGQVDESAQTETADEAFAQDAAGNTGSDEGETPSPLDLGDTSAVSPSNDSRQKDAGNSDDDSDDEVDSSDAAFADVVAATEESAEEESESKQSSSSRNEQEDNPPTDEAPYFSEVPFDPDVTSLPKNFKGNSLTAIYKGVHARQNLIDKTYDRDEFETSREYIQRVNEEVANNTSTIVTGKVRFDSYVAFVITTDPDDRSSRLNAKYDADRKTLTLSFDFKSAVINDSIRGYTTTEGKRDERRYENLFNYVGFPMESTPHIGVYVPSDKVFLSDDDRRWVEQLKEVNLANVPVDVAKKKSTSLRALLVCKLAYIPEGRYLAYSMVGCENVEFWFYDDSTGEIWGKFKLNEVINGVTKRFDASGFASSGSSTVKVKYSTVPFNTSRTTITSEYWGHNPEDVVKALITPTFSTSSIGAEITSSEYSKRIARLAKTSLNEPLYGALKFGSRLAYVIPNAADKRHVDSGVETVKCEYQESTQTMTVRKSTEYEASMFDPMPGTYPTQAVHFSVMKYVNHVYAFELPFKQINKHSSSNFDSWTLTGVSKHEFEKIRDSVRVLCVYTLGYGGNRHLGVFEPRERYGKNTNKYSLICAANPEFWVYDSDSGRILAKFSAPDMFNSVRKKYGQAETGSVVENDESADDSGSDFIGEPIWENVLANAVDTPQSWESKKPTIVLPDDAESLEEAVTKSEKDDVIMIRRGASVPIRKRTLARGEKGELALEHALTIIGETGSPEDATIRVLPGESLRVDAPDMIAFKGITFAAINASGSDDVAPTVYVADEARAAFKYCVFTGDLASDESTGVYVDGEDATASFWRCCFSEFGREGIRMRNGATGKAEYCEFFGKNRYGVSSLDGAIIEVEKSRFDQNITGIQASGGGVYSVTDSFFTGNRSEWSASVGSSKECVQEGNVVRKK